MNANKKKGRPVERERPATRDCRKIKIRKLIDKKKPSKNVNESVNEEII